MMILLFEKLSLMLVFIVLLGWAIYSLSVRKHSASAEDDGNPQGFGYQDIGHRDDCPVKAVIVYLTIDEIAAFEMVAARRGHSRSDAARSMLTQYVSGTQ